MPSELHRRLSANLADVEARMQSACERSARNRSDVTLVAVVKYAAWEWVRGLLDIGVRDFAESRPQQLAERVQRLKVESPESSVRWHFIGHLQRNKVRPVLQTAGLIHSVDSLRLVERIDLLAGELQLHPELLLEVNVSGESSKDGFSPEDLRLAWPEIAKLENVSVRGLMTMAPESENPETARPFFAGLRQLRDDLAARAPGFQLSILSMGMSGDFETAIEEGATLIRVGSRLFAGCADVQ